jgi:tRNA threonylcarbamoyladenosine biosynthesis protein TsaB
MKVLALDTSMQACSAAVYDAGRGRVLAEEFREMERGHAEAIAPMVAAVLAAAGLAPPQLGRIAVTTGPGTFTGVRIGLAMAKGLGLALDLAVLGLPSLRVIAENAVADAVPLAVVADARLDEVYAAIYGSAREELLPPGVFTLEALLDRLPAGPVSVIGSAAGALLAAAGRAGLVRSRAGDLPVASRLARLAAGLPAPEQPPRPLYLRGPGARPQAEGLLPPLAIRDATPLDAGLFAAMHAEAFTAPWPAEDFARLMAMPGARPVIAMSRDEPVGFALVRQAADEAEILTIATRPAYRRRGVARALIEHQRRALEAAGVTALYIEVAPSNLAARLLYEALGFGVAGRRKAYYGAAGGPHEDAIVMRREVRR